MRVIEELLSPKIFPKYNPFNELRIVLLKSLRNFKRHSKSNFMLKSQLIRHKK